MLKNVTTTGVVLFDGKPQVSEGLRAWLKPFLGEDSAALDARSTGLGREGLAFYFEDDFPIHIDTLEEGLLYEAHRLRVGHDDMEYSDLLREIARAHGKTDALADILPPASVLAPPGCIDEPTFSLEAVLRMAITLSEGHNACGMALMSGIASNSELLWSAGGGSSLSLVQRDGSMRTAGFLGMQLLELATGAPEPLGEWFAQTVNIVVPPGQREAVREAFLKALQVPEQAEQPRVVPQRQRYS